LQGGCSVLTVFFFVEFSGPIRIFPQAFKFILSSPVFFFYSNDDRKKKNYPESAQKGLPPRPKCGKLYQASARFFFFLASRYQKKKKRVYLSETARHSSCGAKSREKTPILRLTDHFSAAAQLKPARTFIRFSVAKMEWSPRSYCVLCMRRALH
jgi:hypothetical protein